MKSSKLFFALLIITIVGVGSIFAQQPLSFEIPFDFQVGKTNFEAGKYEIKKLDDKKFIIKNIATNKSKMLVSDAQAGNDAKLETLIFNRYGDTYFLREIYARRETVGRGLTESKAERKTRKEYHNNDRQLAKNKSEPERVSINSAQ